MVAIKTLSVWDLILLSELFYRKKNIWKPNNSFKCISISNTATGSNIFLAMVILAIIYSLFENLKCTHREIFSESG